jgi:predicted ATPase
MRTRRAITEVNAENFLSLKRVRVGLDELTVLVGPNGGGKSNFLSIFRFLGEVARTDLVPAVQSIFGSFGNLVFAGERKNNSVKIGIKAQVTDHSSPSAPDEYSLSFRPIGNIRSVPAFMRHESVVLKRYEGRGRRITLNGRKLEFETTNRIGARLGKLRAEPSGSPAPATFNIEQSSSALSVLRRIGEAHDTRQVAQLADIFENLRLFDPMVPMARRASTRDRGLFLESNASNLAAVLLRLKTETPHIFEALEQDIREILRGFRSFVFQKGGTSEEMVRVLLQESGLSEPTPLERASFGTIRAIALFTMLREPNPPRLTCIEEVDHGLHPYALDVLVERLRDASSRTQIVIATHSPALVNRLQPSELRVFERDWETGETRHVDIEPDTLEEMRQKSGYELGELWFSGALGGTP